MAIDVPDSDRYGGEPGLYIGEIWEIVERTPTPGAEMSTKLPYSENEARAPLDVVAPTAITPGSAAG